MYPGTVKRGIVLFAAILCAVLVADRLAATLTSLAGFTGAAAYFLHFLVYAGTLFAGIAVLKAFAGIDIFRFGGE